MAPVCTQLRIVLWRNFLIKRRGWKCSVLELLIPVLLVAAMVLINLWLPNSRRSSVDQFQSHNTTSTTFSPFLPKSLAVSPAIPLTIDVMNRVSKTFNMTSFEMKDSVTSAGADEDYRKGNMTEVGVELLFRNISGMFSVDGYIVRLPYEAISSMTAAFPFQKYTGRCAETVDGLSPKCPGSQAITSGLLNIQLAVETALIQTFQRADYRPPAVQVQMMPVPAFRPTVTNAQLLVSLSMVIALTPLAYGITVTLVMEKKTRGKVLFNVMGLSDTILWFSWWLVYVLAVLLVSVVASVFILPVHILGGSSLGSFFLLVVLYGASLLSMACLVSVFFTSPKIAGLTTSLLAVLMGLLYLAVAFTRQTTAMSTCTDGAPNPTAQDSAVPLGGQVVLSLLSPTAFALAVDQLVYDAEEGMDNMFTDGQFPLLAAVLMLVLDTALYGVLALYLACIIPNQNQRLHKPCFCFDPSYWRRRQRDTHDGVIPTDTPQGPHIEPIYDSISDCNAVRIRDLCKKFKTGTKEAIFGLNGLDLDIFEGQITCILGHSGSGKSCLLNVLAGITPPSSGLAFVHHLNISSHKDHRKLSTTVSYCPQNNVLLDDLNVVEHLSIAAHIKGIASDSVDNEIQTVVHDFNLDKVKPNLVRELSGSQKRHLSLAMALLGNSKVVLLDEPTVGMEAEERRLLWRLLHARKSGRVIIFTSKHMHEADYFSDRIVVLSRGRLRCVGSSEFLKEHLGAGYRLKVKVRPATNTDRLMRAVNAHVRGATLVHSENNTLTITIPTLQAGKLTALFRQLESTDKGGEHLGLSQFGISFTTLESVFWKLGEEEESGKVFISPLLSFTEDTFPDYDSSPSENSPHLGSTLTPSVPRPRPSITNDENLIGTRRKSAFPVLQQLSEMHVVTVNEDEETHTKTGMSRRFSELFNRRTHHYKPRSGFPGLHTEHFNKDKPKRSVNFTQIFGKEHRDRSKSMAPECARKNHGSHLADFDHHIQSVEERSPSSVTILPASLAERRATVAAFNGLRSVAQQKNVSSVLGFGSHLSTPADPLAKLEMLDAFEQIRKASLIDAVEDESPSEVLNVESDPGNAHALPAKLGEVLDNLKPPEHGIRLELRRLTALLKLRVLMCMWNKWWLLLHAVVPLALALLAVGLSHVLTHPAAQSDSHFVHRIPLFGVSHLVFRNQSGENVDKLLADINGAAGLNQLSEYPSDELHASVGLESLLDILKADGSAYRLNYNATSGIALPQLFSVLAHVRRKSAGLSPLNNSANKAFLASNMTAWLQPWPAEIMHDSMSWVLELLLGMALIFLPLTLVGRMVKERKDKTRSYLGVFGISRLVYYGSAFMANVVEFYIPAGLLLIICATTAEGMFEEEGAVYASVLMVILYGLAGVLWSYVVASFIMTRPSSAFFFFFISLVTLISVGGFFLVNFLDKGDTTYIATILHCVFTVLWTPYVPFGALHFIDNVNFTATNDNDAGHVFLSGFRIYICFIMLAIDVVMFSLLLLLLDRLTYSHAGLLCNNSDRQQVPLDSHCSNIDDSVKSEIQCVHDLHKNESQTQWPRLVIDGLTKVFTQKKQRLNAVDGATLTVQQGEVLGLLGPAGAGKSTMLDMMLGLCPSSGGAIFADSEDVSALTPWERGDRIGFCPSYNPLWDCLTVDQHINLMGAFRGLHQHDLDSFRECLFHDLGLNDYRSHKTEQLLDCEKRKLTFAMSMLGTQRIVVLDEPSAGMDSRSRRLYWDAMTYFLKTSQRSAIVSTQCVDEARTLCSRLSIMINGQLRCLGTADELEERFRQTYSLEVTLGSWDENSGPQRMDMLIMFLQELFPGLTTVEHFHKRAVFRVKCSSEDFSLAGTFNTLESLKRNLDLENFTFCQTDMEQMFLDFVREQKEGDNKFNPLITKTKETRTRSTSEIIVALETEPSYSQDDRPAQNIPSAVLHITHARSNDTDGEGGASSEDLVSEAHAAIGEVLQLHGDDTASGVSEMEKVATAEAGAAATVFPVHME